MRAITQQRPVLITGCSSGIGACVADGLRQRGYPVIATARQEADVARLRQAGHFSLRLDLDDSTSIQDAFAATLEHTGGRLYALFNNGAYGQPGAVEDLTRAALRAQFETNLFGTHELTRLAISVMRPQGEGRIIQNSSLLGFVAMPYRGAYTASKYALEGLSDTLRLELQGSGIQISLIEPGPIDSRFRTNALAKWQEYVDSPASPHHQAYAAMQQRLVKEGPAVPFTLPPEAVLRQVIHALEARHARRRYPVTLPSHLFIILKRLLPTALLDRALGMAGGSGKR